MEKFLERERLDQPEIAITPEMVAAGMAALSRRFIAVARGDDAAQAQVVCEIFVKMAEMQQKGRHAAIEGLDLYWLASVAQAKFLFCRNSYSNNAFLVRIPSDRKANAAKAAKKHAADCRAAA
jgi:hypothetical protein